jgi:transcriptional regulator with XRE-family HTH domain
MKTYRDPKIGKWIRHGRILKGLSIQEVARRAGCSHVTVIAIEKGYIRRFEIVKAVGRVVGLRVYVEAESIN